MPCEAPLSPTNAMTTALLICWTVLVLRSFFSIVRLHELRPPAVLPPRRCYRRRCCSEANCMATMRL
eukprot:9912558-Heterocapsa_arctica.AAC.1